MWIVKLKSGDLDLKQIKQAIMALMVFGFAISVKAEETVNELVSQGEKTANTIGFLDFLIPIGCGVLVWSFAYYKGKRPKDPQKARLQFDLPIGLGILAWIAGNCLP